MDFYFILKSNVRHCEFNFDIIQLRNHTEPDTQIK